MRTSKPIATISYNSQEYLIGKLEELQRSKKICDWVFINHFAEKDERKNHIHLWIKPNTLVDTMELQDFFKEPDPKNPKKPLGCIDFVSSKIDDWILYSMHLEPYLASKGEIREFHYTRDDFVFADEDGFEFLYNHALYGSEWSKKAAMIKLLMDEHIRPEKLIEAGLIPLNLASNVSAYRYMKSEGKGIFRNGRLTHTPKKKKENIPEGFQDADGYEDVFKDEA